MPRNLGLEGTHRLVVPSRIVEHRKNHAAVLPAPPSNHKSLYGNYDRAKGPEQIIHGEANMLATASFIPPKRSLVCGACNSIMVHTFFPMMCEVFQIEVSLVVVERLCERSLSKRESLLPTQKPVDTSNLNEIPPSQNSNLPVGTSEVACARGHAAADEITATREHVNHLGVGHEYDGPSCSMTRDMIMKVAASSGVDSEGKLFRDVVQEKKDSDGTDWILNGVLGVGEMEDHSRPVHPRPESSGREEPPHAYPYSAGQYSAREQRWRGPKEVVHRAPPRTSVLFPDVLCPWGRASNTEAPLRPTEREKGSESGRVIEVAAQRSRHFWATMGTEEGTNASSSSSTTAIQRRVQLLRRRRLNGFQ
ncbi:hypothetical protein B0H14DRAFT_3149205 [Mycena olivaceomarginata]|nr:hypothetical protein B0H14DRAFT_3149205 [Mycena olivaceomarginata]